MNASPAHLVDGLPFQAESWILPEMQMKGLILMQTEMDKPLLVQAVHLKFLELHLQQFLDFHLQSLR